MIKALLIFFVALTLAVGAAENPSIRIIVLGIAQDGGIPQIGCNQEICRTQSHAISSLAIVQNDRLFLIDATPDLRRQYQELARRKPAVAKKALFDGVFLTHAHMGHYSGLLYLGKESISTQETPVFCSEEMISYLKKNAPWNLLTDNGNIQLRPFTANQTLDVGFKITPLPVPHRKEFTDTYGFLIQGQQKSLLYIPDIDAWEPIKDSLIDWLNQSDYALLDGTFYSGNELPGRDMTKVPHPTIERSIGLFKTFPKFSTQIYFTHLNHTNPVLNPNSREFNAVRKAGYHVAVDWQEFEL